MYSGDLVETQQITVAVGEAFNLSCNNYVGVGETTVVWSKWVAGFLQLLNNGEVTGIQDNILYRPSAQPAHEGQYTCTVENSKTGSDFKRMFEVTVSGLYIC